MYRAVEANKHRIYFACAGIQGGKSLLGAHVLRHWVTRNRHLPDATYIAAMPTYNHLDQGMFQAFRKVFPSDWGSYNQAQRVYKLRNGHRIIFRSMIEDPEKAEGTTDVMGIWADEAGQFPHRAWVNLLARTSFNAAPIVITSTPYGLGWMYTVLYEPWERDTDESPQWWDSAGTIRVRHFIFCRVWESVRNPAFKENISHIRRFLTDEEYERKYCGKFTKLAGLVYEEFEKKNHVIPSFDVPPHWPRTAGVDWGFGDLFAITVRAHGPDGISYQVAEYVRSGLSAPDMIRWMVKAKGEWNIRIFHCDPSRPDMIAGANQEECKSIAANNDRLYGIGQHRALIKEYRHFIFDTCPETISAYSIYKWPEHKDQDKPPPSAPAHLGSDTMDANRYDTVMNLSMPFNTMSKHVPHLPAGEDGTVDFTKQQTLRDRIKALEKPGGYDIPDFYNS